MRATTTLATVALVSTLALAACGQEEPETRHLSSSPSEQPQGGQQPPPAEPPRTEQTSPASQAADPYAPPSGETAAPTYAGVLLSPPDSWIAEEPASTMRLAQFRIGNPAGEDATLAILHFGERGAGGVQENLARWAREMTDERGEVAVPDIGEINAAALKITTFQSRGTYAAAAPMGGAGEPKSDWMSLAAIIEGGPEGPIYLKLTGPADLLEEQVDDFEAMLRAARSTAPGASGG